MRRHSLFTIALWFVIAQTTWAQTPSTLGYQGYLTDTAGNAVSDGTYSVIFSLYTADSGGSALWTETQNVTTSGGVFTATLGSGTAITLPFTAQYYLGISVSGGSELSIASRHKIYASWPTASVLYALASLLSRVP